MSLLLRRHYYVIILLLIVLTGIVLFLGDQRVVAYTTRPAATTEPELAEGVDYHNDIALFDDSTVHSIQVLMSDEEYDQMIATYQQTGLKEYFHADVIIDGERVDNVGIRLKGNASLRTALGGRGGEMGGGRRGFGDLPADGWLPERPDAGQRPVFPPQGELRERPEGFQLPEGGDAMPGWLPGSGGSLDGATTSEVKIPFLIKFDEYVSGQSYQGYTRIAIRTYGVTPDAAMLAEPVTNDTARLVGLPATQTTFAGFSFNDEKARLYVVSEVIDEEYLAKYFENSDGVLYKAEVGSTLSYQGEDPSAYDQDFSQETFVNDADMAPLIAFMRFLDQADDATFEAQLPEYLDVESFATYLALNALLVNTDSIIGMNNNYYMYYDRAAERFTLLMWDANESFDGLGGMNSTAYALDLSSSQEGFRGPGGGENALVERFMANTAFRTLYEQKLVEVYEQAFASGAIVEDIQRYAALIRSTNDELDLVDIEQYDQAVQELLDFVAQRMAYLETTSLLGK